MRLRQLCCLAIAALAWAGCAGPNRVSRLNAMQVHVHVHPNGWYEMRSENGYRFALPGIPSVERVTYDGPGGPIRALRYELVAEGNSRGFYLTVFELGDRTAEDRAAVLEAATRSLVPANATIAERRSVAHGGLPAQEVLVENVTRNQHSLLARSFVHGDRAFQAAAVMAPAAGLPRDVRAFFDSIEVRGSP